ncbi:MAG TPA: nucleotidyltransferase family protein [Nocardioides sp.]|nr:nucleotidyltransferase family protein [Nocardioides sp.]
MTAICLDVCRRPDPVVPELPGIGDDLVRAVRFHRIAPLAHVALRDTRPDLAALLAEDRHRALAHHVRVTASLAALGDTLDGIPWAVVKGPVLSESLHPVAGLRSYGDVDLLVAPADLRAAGERMLRAGWQVLAARDDLLNGEVTGELELGHPAGAVVDLHWSLVLSETLRRRFRVPTVELLGRSTPVAIGPVEVCTLDDVDTLVHLCHHAAYSGAVRLLHLLDVDQAARRIQDWDPVVERALAWGAGAQVGLVLARSRRLLDTPVPPDVARRLGLSRGFTRLGSVVDSRWPAPALRRESSWPRLVARAAYPTATATAAAAARNAVLGAVNRVRPEARAGRAAPAGRDDVDAWFTAVERVAAIPPAP